MAHLRYFSFVTPHATRMLPFAMAVLLAGALGFVAGCTDQGDPLKPPSGSDNPPVASDSVDWVHHVGPLLQTNCVSCHGGPAPLAQFDASTYASVMNHTTAAGNATIVPFDTSASELLLRVEGRNFARMPQGGMLSDAQIDTIRNWILDGAPERVTVDTTGGN